MADSIFTDLIIIYIRIFPTIQFVSGVDRGYFKKGHRIFLRNYWRCDQDTGQKNIKTYQLLMIFHALNIKSTRERCKWPASVKRYDSHQRLQWFTIFRSLNIKKRSWSMGNFNKGIKKGNLSIPFHWFTKNYGVVFIWLNQQLLWMLQDGSLQDQQGSCDSILNP